MKPNHIKATMLTIGFYSSAVFANTCATPANGQYTPQADKICAYGDTFFMSSDGLKMPTNLFLPKAVSGQTKYPVVVFTTSTGMPKPEYIGASFALAKKGYIVATVLSRGFFRAPGLAVQAAPISIDDTSRQIDWLLAHTPTDANKIGLAGISLGAAVSMLTANVDPRIKAVASLSGRTDVLEGMLPNGATNAKSYSNLIASTALTAGQMSPELPKIIDLIKDPYLTTSTINDVVAPWARIRSPIFNLDGINTRKVPVLIQHNFQDQLYNPNSTIKLYNALTNPKRLELLQGAHAAPDTFWAIFGQKSGFEPVYRWFDRFLKNERNGVDTELPIGMRAPSAQVSDRYTTIPNTGLTYYLKARPQPSTASVNFGGLQSAQVLDNQQNAFETSQNTPADKNDQTTGLTFVKDKYAIVYQTNVFQADTALRGTPKLRLYVTPNASTIHMVAYLYELDSTFKVGTLITHAPITLRDVMPNQTIPVNLDLFMTAYNVKKGKRLALVIDGRDDAYTRPAAASSTLTINTGSAFPSSLLLPINPY